MPATVILHPKHGPSDDPLNPSMAMVTLYMAASKPTRAGGHNTEDQRSLSRVGHYMWQQ